MLSLRRVALLGLFVVCLVVSTHSPAPAQGTGPKKHPVIHKAIHDLRDAHKRLKALKPIYHDHREKAMKHIDHAIVELHKAIEFADGGKNR